MILYGDEYSSPFNFKYWNITKDDPKSGLCTIINNPFGMNAVGIGDGFNGIASDKSVWDILPFTGLVSNQLLNDARISQHLYK